MKTHLDTAHEYGVAQALKQAGYASIDEVQKEAEALGIASPSVAPTTTAPKTAADTSGVLAFLKAKLG